MGNLTLGYFLDSSQSAQLDWLEEQFPHGLLIVSRTHSGPVPLSSDPERFQTLTAHVVHVTESDEERGRQVVAIEKRLARQQAFMVTVGRTQQCDLVFDDPGVSKFHAYFRHDVGNGEYLLCDPGSRNGTAVEGRDLAPNAHVRLAGGERIVFGGTTAAIFHTAASFHRYLALLRRLS